MKKLLIALSVVWGVLVTIGIIFPNYYESLFDRLFLGAISYPLSLDNFENPTPTQSVATVVTHSTQHSNANDAIEALEAKVGVTSSTAVANSILNGNGAGSSIWTTFATTTSVASTNILATGSTTLQNFTFKNATGTQATTTSFAIIGLSAQIPYANAGGSIIPLTIGSGLTLSGGSLSATAVGGAIYYATTSIQNLATSTISNLAAANTLRVTATASTTAAASGMWVVFNDNMTANAYYSGASEDGSTLNTSDSNALKLHNNTNKGYYLDMTVSNLSTGFKRIDFTMTGFDVNGNVGHVYTGGGVWKNNTQISSISFAPVIPSDGTVFQTGMNINVEAY